MTTYLFAVDGNRVILNDERSGIGYCYPRIFVESARSGNHANFDVTLCRVFNQSQAEFESWLDGTEVANANIEAVCADLGIKYDAMLSVVRDILARL